METCSELSKSSGPKLTQVAVAVLLISSLLLTGYFEWLGAPRTSATPSAEITVASQPADEVSRVFA
jgi:hypothetical protein